ncbi:MAG: hypothetical protein CEE40_09980 [Chloroflexi bacterium B3_Chlor]|nr:MAG: hypothetical protein CEE40_09980 [Chloroflexi bacterium B3_Chlor]
MSKANVFFSILFASLVVLALAVACGGQEQPSEVSPPSSTASGAELLQERCTRCHTLDRVRASSKTEAEWEATVGRMRGKGAELTDAEAQTLIEYLAEAYGP